MIKFLILPVFLLSLMMGGCTTSTPPYEFDPNYNGDYSKGHEAYDKGDYAAARREWEPLARHAHGGAQYYLGFMHEKGQGVPQDDNNAFMWYSNASVHGNVLAQYKVGMMYSEGRAVTRNEIKAITWLKMAAQGGDERARVYLRKKYDCC